MEDGNTQSAEKRLHFVLTRAPQHANANIAMGDLRIKEQKLEEAKTHYKIAIKADPESGSARYKLSNVLYRLKQSDRAAEERARGAALNAAAAKRKRTVFVLAEPDGKPLMGGPQ